MYAFQGTGRSEADWRKMFTHYFNLLVCLELIKLSFWVEEITGSSIESEDLERCSIELALTTCTDLREFEKAIKVAISKLQISVNNPQSADQVLLSIAESPIRTLTEVLIHSLDRDEKTIFCCLDEYENLLDYQQEIVNTYIKHARPPLSYKIGVRKYGQKNHRTLDKNDLLKMPDDYREIEIADEGFASFAVEVVEKRLHYARSIGIKIPEKLNIFLRELSFREEADSLGAKTVADSVLTELKESCPELISRIDDVDFSELYFLQYWAEQESTNICQTARELINNEKQWKTRFGNYKYASLFWLTSGRKGIRIRKYYCGQTTFLSLASGNIRFFLELIDQAISNELTEINHQIFDRELTISPKSQTLAAKKVGERNLDQLESLADNGVQLKRLVLAIGKVFFEFAKSPIGRTPEVTSFLVEGDPEPLEKMRLLLRQGVDHLAIEAFPRTKATTSSELRDDEYRIHPIFCAFFEMSHRRKRRTTFYANHLLDAVGSKPSEAIVKLMGGGEHSDIDELPEQLALFGSFYSANDSDE